MTKDTTGLDIMEPIHQVLTASILDKAQELIGPAEEWGGRCYEIASKLVKHKLVTGTPVYGHWIGPVSPTGHWADRRNHGFIQHGWVQAPDGKIVDPTRFAFEGVDPYIYMGPNKGCYDEGGNTLRLAMEQPCPAYQEPNGDGFPRVYDVETKSLADEPREFMLALMGAPTVNNNMIFWLANLAPERLGEHRDALYEFICSLPRMAGAIPQDNRKAWMRKTG